MGVGTVYVEITVFAELVLTTASTIAARVREVVVGLATTGVSTLVVVGATTTAALVVVIVGVLAPAFSLSTRTAVLKVLVEVAKGPLLQVADIGSQVLVCQLLQSVMYCQPTRY
jgi:hypothetical protein